MTQDQHSEHDHLDFTGERLILEPGTPWFWESRSLEHVGRYLFAADRVHGLHVLDAACGTGYGSALLARSAAAVTGVDIDPQTIGFASGWWGSPSVRFDVADVASLPFADATFDAIVSFETIEHVPDPAATLAEFHRVLVPGGPLIVSTPSRDVYNWVSFPHGDGNPFHPSELTPEEFVAALERHYVIESLHGQVHVPGFGAAESPSTPRSRSPVARLARSAIKGTTSWFLSRPAVAGRALRLLRPGFLPQPMDDRPWKYVVAVARSRR